MQRRDVNWMQGEINEYCPPKLFPVERATWFSAWQKWRMSGDEPSLGRVELVGNNR